MNALIGIVICALLFALYGFVKQRGCNGHCAGCLGACGRSEGTDHHD